MCVVRNLMTIFFCYGRMQRPREYMKEKFYVRSPVQYVLAIIFSKRTKKEVHDRLNERGLAN